jgi:hypothetical protein
MQSYSARGFTALPDSQSRPFCHLQLQATTHEERGWKQTLKISQAFRAKLVRNGARSNATDQTRRQPGLLGSTSVKSTGAIPNSAITAGSFASRLTPS